MIKVPVNLQDLRRRIYQKAKSDKQHRFWGIFVHIAKIETLLLLVVLGQAGEEIGFDKKLKVNTVKTRTHSLFRQGQFYYRFFFRFTQEEQDNLMQNFDNLLQKQGFWTDFLRDLK